MDVIMITKNSVRPCLEKCLESIYQNLPISRLIVVDGGSEDDTLAKIERFCQDKRLPLKIFVDKEGNRATSREIGIANVKTEWFMFVDSDVILSKNWYEEAEKFISPKVGAIWGLNADYPDYDPNEKMEDFKRRGGCHDILIRREAIRNIRIPKDLDFYEDWYIKTWMEKQGWEIVATKNPYCYHFHLPKITLERSRKETYLAHKYGIQQPSPLFYLRNFLYRSFGWGLLIHPVGFFYWKRQLRGFFYGFLANVICKLGG